MKIDNYIIAAIYIACYYGWGVIKWAFTKKMSSWIPGLSIFLLMIDDIRNVNSSGADWWYELSAGVIPPAFMTFAILVFMGYVK